MAFAASGNDGRAQEELASLDGVIENGVIENGGIEGLLVRANRATDLLDIADIHLTATLANNDGRTDEAELLLGQMVRKEDSLPYIEPLNWFTTARIELGALLLSKGRPDEAEIMFSQDLRVFPNNVWSLHGLWRSLETQGKTGEANQAKQLFDVAMTKADVVFE